MNKKINCILSAIILIMCAFCAESAFAQSTLEKPKRPGAEKPKTEVPKKKAQPSAPKSQKPAPKQEVSGSVNGHDYVDLGLSVKWATCNIGATSHADYGDYYAWGETSPKKRYDVENSKWWNVANQSLKEQGVIDSNGNLTPKYDAASVLWGGEWRMPTLDEVKELHEKCQWKQSTEGGKKGYRVTGPNGKSIFLPATGRKYEGRTYGTSQEGKFWSSTQDNYKYSACYLGFFEADHDWSEGHNSTRSDGHTIRPVIQ